MNPTEGLKDEESSVLDEVLQTGHQEEVVYQNLDQTQIWLFGWFFFFFWTSGQNQVNHLHQYQ